jgi:Protein of unknown function (DUF2782)
MNRIPALALVCASLPCWAQTTAQTTAPTQADPVAAVPAAAAERGEPNVRYTLIEDDGSKIDELRVRGQLQHVVVTPKVGTTKSYEIIISRSGRDPVDGTGGANSAAGKRVWNVLNF